MLTLGIETSCDETAAAVARDGNELLSNTVHSQIPVHARYGGVVPELASRNHVMAILPVIQQALRDAATTLADLDLVAVTVGPGLVGSLLVGLETAKVLAFVHDLPLLGVNHIEGHLLSPWIDAQCRGRMAFPYVALVVSGGHTSLFHVRNVGDYRRLGRTLDDAAGEAFDKVAKRLGAEYPGGPFVDRRARDGDPERYPMPTPMLGRGLDFSFSGLKTAAATLIGRLEQEAPDGGWLPDVCAAVQESVVRVLLSKALEALERTRVERLVIAGGVACNSALRRAAAGAAERLGVELLVPAPSLCTDNGAMIACAGTLHAQLNRPARFDAFDLDVDAGLVLK